MAVCGWPHEAAQAPWVVLGSAQPQSNSAPTAEGDYPFDLGELIASPNSLYEILGFLGKGTFGQVGHLGISTLLNGARVDDSSPACSVGGAVVACSVYWLPPLPRC